MRNRVLNHVLNKHGNFDISSKDILYTHKNIAGSYVSIKLNQSLSKGKRVSVQGICIARKQRMDELYLTVRSLNSGFYVDYHFPIHSPSIEEVKLLPIKKYLSRRSKIYNVKPR